MSFRRTQPASHLNHNNLLPETPTPTVRGRTDHKSRRDLWSDSFPDRHRRELLSLEKHLASRFYLEYLHFPRTCNLIYKNLRTEIHKVYKLLNLTENPSKKIKTPSDFTGSEGVLDRSLSFLNSDPCQRGKEGGKEDFTSTDSFLPLPSLKVEPRKSGYSLSPVSPPLGPSRSHPVLPLVPLVLFLLLSVHRGLVRPSLSLSKFPREGVTGGRESRRYADERPTRSGFSPFKVGFSNSSFPQIIF